MIYLDSAATTPVHADVLDTFIRANEQFWGNPHSLHALGYCAEQLLEQSRNQIVQTLGGSEHFQLVFTSGATESNNTVIHAISSQYQMRGKHIIAGVTEHPSVREPLLQLEKEGFEITFLPVERDGTVSPDELQKACRSDTILVSIMHVNNEQGAINDIVALREVVREHGKNAFFHVDAAQSVGKLFFELDAWGIDFLSLSAHKCEGLKGSGALFFRKKAGFYPLIFGGGQEFDLRSGTVDVPRAAALAKTLRLATESRADREIYVRALHNRLWDGLASISGVDFNSTRHGSPWIININIDGVKPETILRACSEQEIYVSTVSACSSRKVVESYVIKACTGSAERGRQSVRLSLSHHLTELDIDTTVNTVRCLLNDLR